MALVLVSRRVGDVTVVKCSGRITQGPESDTLSEHLSPLLAYRPLVALDLGDIQFMDSSGLGLLVRLLTRIQTSQGSLKLCAVPANIREVLRVTKLGTIFETYESDAEAIAAFYGRAESAGAPHRFASDILCVDRSADVLAYVRQLLVQAGYGVTTVDNLPDALTLLRAIRPRLVVIGAELRSAGGTRTAERFSQLTEALAVVELPPGFSSDEAGHAGHLLLDRVRALI